MNRPNPAVLIPVLVLLILAMTPFSASAQDPITFYYFHRPPYYVRGEDGTATGFLLEVAKHAMRKGGIPYRFVELPPKRILKRIMKGEACGSVGWFRTPEREAYARFSRPIYRNRPLCMVTRKEIAQGLRGKPAIRDLFAGDLRLGLIDSFSYGTWADRAIERFEPKRTRIATNQENLLQMILKSRIDYALMAPEEAAYVLSREPSFQAGLELTVLADAPPGNERHIMFGNRIDPQQVEAIDRAIEALLETETYETLTRLPDRSSP